MKMFMYQAMENDEWVHERDSLVSIRESMQLLMEQSKDKKRWKKISNHDWILSWHMKTEDRTKLTSNTHNEVPEFKSNATCPGCDTTYRRVSWERRKRRKRWTIELYWWAVVRRRLDAQKEFEALERLATLRQMLVRMIETITLQQKLTRTERKRTDIDINHHCTTLAWMLRSAIILRFENTFPSTVNNGSFLTINLNEVADRSLISCLLFSSNRWFAETSHFWYFHIVSFISVRAILNCKRRSNIRVLIFDLSFSFFCSWKLLYKLFIYLPSTEITLWLQEGMRRKARWFLSNNKFFFLLFFLQIISR